MPIALSGVIQVYDADMLAGAQLEAKRINDAGGVDGHMIEIVSADTHSDIAQGGAAALTVIDQGAQFMIPTLDYNYGSAAAREAMKHKMIAVSLASDLRYALPIGPYMFNLSGAAPNEGAALANFAAKKGWKSVYVLTDTATAFSTSVCGAFSDTAKKLGIDVSRASTFQQADQSIATQVTDIRSGQSSIDAVMMCSLLPGANSALRQIRAGGVTKPMLLTTGFDNNLWQSALPDPGELYISSNGIVTPGQNPDPTSAKVFADYTAATGKEVTNAAAVLTGVSAIQVIADAVKSTNSVDADLIKGYLERFDAKELAFGPTTWTATCHVSKPRPMQIADVKDGKLAYVDTITPTVLPEKIC